MLSCTKIFKKCKNELSLLLVGLMIASSCFIVACDEDNPTYHYKIIRTNIDGTIEVWVVKEKKLSEGFVYWTHSNGGNRFASGNIDIIPIRVDPPKKIEKE